jgi:hypothetical protein
MPNKMMMVLPKNNAYHYNSTYSVPATNAMTLATGGGAAKPTRLNSSMIQRIHTAKPGCGSCGR